MQGVTTLSVGQVGVFEMTTMTVALGATRGIAQILMVAALGFGLLFVAGHAQSATLHDAAHDVRHATGFPCH